jgi:signal transduction histidine kinase
VRAPDGSEIAQVLVPFSGEEDDLSQVERDFLARVYFSVVLGSVIGGAVAFGAGLVIASRLTRPLRRLTTAARRLASGEQHEPIAAPHTTELDELARSFNTMAAELEHQQQLRRQLVADIAHELRTPLSVLRLQIESIEDGVEPPTPAVMASLGEEVSLLTRLVEDLRLLSLADAGQLSLSIAPVDAAQALDRAASAAAARARKQQIALHLTPPTAPLSVLADQQRLGQILANLVENALRYTPAGGSVTLNATRARAEGRGQRAETASALCPLPSALIIFEVRDTGPGMPPAELARIFDRFYRTDQARARETGGSGLGLAIVQRLAEMHGGRVWAESTVGSGTSFFVALPEAVAVPMVARKDGESQRQASRSRNG